MKMTEHSSSECRLVMLAQNCRAILSHIFSVCLTLPSRQNPAPSERGLQLLAAMDEMLVGGLHEKMDCPDMEAYFFSKVRFSRKRDGAFMDMIRQCNAEWICELLMDTRPLFQDQSTLLGQFMFDLYQLWVGMNRTSFILRPTKQD